MCFQEVAEEPATVGDSNLTDRDACELAQW